MTRPTDDSMNDRSAMTETLQRLRAAADELERRGRAITSPTVRHDLSNAVGAARNAIELLNENAEPEVAARFMEIVQRNVQRATQLCADAGVGESRSGRNERDDLRGTGEREHRETFGL